MTPLARTLRVLPHASRPRPGAPFCTGGRARLVRLGVIILVVVVTGAAALSMIVGQTRGRRRARCATPAGRQWRWPARLRRAAGRTDPLLLFATLVLVVATLVLVVLTFLTLLAVDRSVGNADKAPTARWPVPAAAAQPTHPDRWRIGEVAGCRRQLSLRPERVGFSVADMCGTLVPGGAESRQVPLGAAGGSQETPERLPCAGQVSPVGAGLPGMRGGIHRTLHMRTSGTQVLAQGDGIPRINLPR
jgi:hypothetical protein